MAVDPTSSNFVEEAVLALGLSRPSCAPRPARSGGSASGHSNTEQGQTRAALNAVEKLVLDDERPVLPFDKAPSPQLCHLLDHASRNTHSGQNLLGKSGLFPLGQSQLATACNILKLGYDFHIQYDRSQTWGLLLTTPSANAVETAIKARDLARVQLFNSCGLAQIVPPRSWDDYPFLLNNDEQHGGQLDFRFVVFASSEFRYLYDHELELNEPIVRRTGDANGQVVPTEYAPQPTGELVSVGPNAEPYPSIQIYPPRPFLLSINPIFLSVNGFNKFYQRIQLDGAWLATLSPNVRNAYDATKSLLLVALVDPLDAHLAAPPAEEDEDDNDDHDASGAPGSGSAQGSEEVVKGKRLRLNPGGSSSRCSGSRRSGSQTGGARSGGSKGKVRGDGQHVKVGDLPRVLSLDSTLSSGSTDRDSTAPLQLDQLSSTLGTAPPSPRPTPLPPSPLPLPTELETFLGEEPLARFLSRHWGSASELTTEAPDDAGLTEPEQRESSAGGRDGRGRSDRESESGVLERDEVEPERWESYARLLTNPQVPVRYRLHLLHLVYKSPSPPTPLSPASSDPPLHAHAASHATPLQHAVDGPISSACPLPSSAHRSSSDPSSAAPEPAVDGLSSRRLYPVGTNDFTAAAKKRSYPNSTGSAAGKKTEIP
ncbi:hypothetical protein JCM8097_002175 [Rhodosporidiobolus ruineniae]